MRNKRFLAGLAASALGVLVAATASSTVLEHMDLERLSQVATVVVVGDVQAVEAGWNAEQTKIYTRATIVPSEVLKGPSGLASVTVKTIGGQVGEQTASLPGAPRFAVGERVLVFLEPRDDQDGYHVVGLFQGVFRVVAGSGGGEELLQQDVPGYGVGLALRDDRAGASEQLTLADVRRALKGGGR